MHRSESEQLAVCCDCGAEFRLGSDRGFSFGTRGLLCWECAVRRGGRYDHTHEHWSEAPRIDDLGSEFD